MSSIFPASALDEIDSAVQEALGAAASVVGQGFDVRRIGPTTSGSITNAPPILTNFPAKIERTTSRAKVEGMTFDLVVYEAICDAGGYLQLQDLLTENAATVGSTEAAFTFVQRRPPQKAILIRTEAYASITRPIPDGGQAAQQPASGAIASDEYFGVYKAGEWVLTLTDGLYAFVAPTASPAPSPAAVPVGLQPLNRIRDSSEPAKMAVRHYRDHFIAYIPLLPGEQLNEMDRINVGQSDRYQVASLYTSSEAGITGTIAIVEKLA